MASTCMLMWFLTKTDHHYMQYNYTHYYIITINLMCCVFYFCRTLSSSLCLFVHLFMLQLPGRRFGSNHPGWKARQLCAVHSRSHPLLPPLRVSHCTGPQTRSGSPQNLLYPWWELYFWNLFGTCILFSKNTLFLMTSF